MSVVGPLRDMKDAHIASSVIIGVSLSVCNVFNVGSDISVFGLATLSSTTALNVKGYVKAEGSVSLVHWAAVDQILTVISHESTGDKITTSTAGNIGGIILSVVG